MKELPWWLVWPVGPAPNLRRLSGRRLWLVAFPFRNDSRRRQENDLSTFLRSSFPLQLFGQQVPALGTNVIFLAVNFLLQTLLALAAQITENHDFPPEFFSLLPSRCGFLNERSRIVRIPFVLEANNSSVAAPNYLRHQEPQIDSCVPDCLGNRMCETRLVVPLNKKRRNRGRPESSRLCGSNRLLGRYWVHFDRSLLFASGVAVPHHYVEIRTSVRKRLKCAGKDPSFVFSLRPPKRYVLHRN